MLSCVQILASSRTVARLASQSMGFFGQEYWSGLPFPCLEDLPDPGIEPVSPTPPALAGGFFTSKPPGTSLVAQTVKRLLQFGKPGFDPWVEKKPWTRKWQPTPVLLPGKSYGWRSLVGYIQSMELQRFHAHEQIT